MDCPSDTTLHAYLQGELPDEERDALEHHVNACQRCGEALGRLTSASENIINKPKGLCPPEVEGLDSDLAEELQAKGFVVVKKLGAGGFGMVFQAKDIELQRDVAIKILNKKHLSSPAVVSRFEQEIRTLAGIEHHGVVR